MHAVCTRLSARRIWALARVALKEAIRSRVVLIFSLMAVIFLFADWFVPYKAEHQLRNYVRAIYWSMPPLFLLTAGLLGAFSIPNDLRSQAMFTIVTKPVERMEIVLAREWLALSNSGVELNQPDGGGVHFCIVVPNR